MALFSHAHFWQKTTAEPDGTRKAAPGPEVTAGCQTIIACPNCDLLNCLSKRARPALVCARCGAVLYRNRPNSIERSLALTLTALMLFFLSNSFPFLALKSGGFEQQTTLLTGIRQLWQQGLYEVSLLVLITCILVPLVQMAGLLYILAPLKILDRQAPWSVHVLRMVKEVAPWGMMEIFMIGILVALVKLGHMATIVPGISALSYGLLIFVMAAAMTSLDLPLLWDRLDLRR